MTMPIPMHPLVDYRPYSNIQPFTVRDGVTYLLQIETLLDWTRETLVPHIDGEVSKLAESWEENSIALVDAWTAMRNELVTRVEEAEANLGTAVTDAEAAKIAAEAARDLAAIYASDAAEIQDVALTTIWGDADSSFRTAVFATLSTTFNDLANGIEQNEANVSALGERVVAAEKVTEGTIVPVEAFGAVGDGVTDDTPFINAAVASGKRVKFKDGSTYRLGSVITGSNIDIDADGATFIVDHPANAVQMNGVMSDAVAVNSWTQADEMTSVSGAATGVVTIMCAANPPASWKRGDVVVMASDDILPYSRDAQTGNAAQNRTGQFLRIMSVNGSQIKAMGRVNDPQMVTNVRIARIETVGKFKWRGGTFDYSDEQYANGNGYTFFVTKHVAPVIRDVTIKRIKSGAVYLRTCHSWLVDGINVGGGVNDLTRGAYGYGVANFNSAFGILSNSYFTDVRHSYTNGGSFLEAGGMSCDGYGRPHDNLITDCVTESASASAYDSHTQGRREMFMNCRAYNCSGFFLRGTYHTVQNAVVVGGEKGFTVQTESTGDRSYGHIIDGLTIYNAENVGVVDVNMKLGGVAFHTKETNVIVLRNVVAKFLKGRIVTLNNATMNMENIHVEQLAEGTSFAPLIANSDVNISDVSVYSNGGVFTSCVGVAGNGISNAASSVFVDGFHVFGESQFSYFFSGTTIGTSFKANRVFMKNLPTVAATQNSYTAGNTPKPVTFP